MTLEEYFRRNCIYLEAAVLNVPAKRDLAPLFAAVKDDSDVYVPINLLQIFNKETAINVFSSFLRAIEADRYAIIIAAWYVAVREGERKTAFELINREGTGTVYKELRKECYAVIVGDREKSLTATYDVERDYKGKICRLHRLPDAPQGGFGRGIDLLVERTVH